MWSFHGLHGTGPLGQKGKEVILREVTIAFKSLASCFDCLHKCRGLVVSHHIKARYLQLLFVVDREILAERMNQKNRRCRILMT